jgi:hypothetical protein
MSSPHLPLASVARFVVLTLFASVALVGCITTDGTGTSSGTSASSSGSSTADSGATTAAGKACLDTADAYATAAARCGGTYAAEHTAFIQNLAGGDCNSVSIRNETELRTQCFPSLTRIPCADLTNNRVDPSCAEQIIRTK